MVTLNRIRKWRLCSLRGPAVPDGAIYDPVALTRCGLAFTGANHAPESATSNDGRLTGIEILNMNLRGTEMVVLSACQTGVGRQRSGEGVAGLRQAFRLAGANQVIASLWFVHDESTAELMNQYWQNVARGNSPLPRCEWRN